MKRNRFFKKVSCLFSRATNLLGMHLRALTFRKKLMIASLLLISASYYSAPIGMVVLGVGLIAEWRKSPARSLSLFYILKKSVVFLPGLVFLLSAVVGALLYGHYLNAALGFAVLGPVLFCMTGIEILWTKEDALHFARYAATLMVPLALIAFAMACPGQTIYTYFETIRATSTFSNANYFAYAIEMILLFSIALYYHVWQHYSRILLLISTLLSALCLYFTGSRTGMLAFLAGLTVFYLCMSEKRVLSFLFGGITAALIAVALFPEMSVGIFRDLIPRPETFLAEIENRFILWDAAWKQIAVDPVVGRGLLSFPLMIPKNAPEVLRVSVHCHNVFLNLWLETGVTGLLAFLWICLRAALTAVRRLKYSSVRPYLSAGVALVTVTFVHGIMDATLISSQTLAIFGIFLACLIVMNRKTVNF